MSAEHFDLDRDNEPEDDWQVIKSPDWGEPVNKSPEVPAYAAMLEQARREICAAMGLPAYLFRSPVVYHDPYPEEIE